MQTSTSHPVMARMADRLVQLDDAGMRCTLRARRRWLTRLMVPYTGAGTIGLPWIGSAWLH